MSEEARNRPRESGADNIRAARDNPGVAARPPLIYLCSILIGLALQFVWPLKVLPAALEATLGGSLIAGCYCRVHTLCAAVPYYWNGDSNASADHRHYQDRTISTQSKPYLSIFHSPLHRHRDLGQQRLASRNIDPHAPLNFARGHREGGEVLGAKIWR